MSEAALNTILALGGWAVAAVTAAFTVPGTRSRNVLLGLAAIFALAAVSVPLGVIGPEKAWPYIIALTPPLTVAVVAFITTRQRIALPAIAVQEGRRLSADQKLAIVGAAKGTAYTSKDISVIYPMQSLECIYFATDIADALNLAGWSVQPDILFFASRVKTRGLFIEIASLSSRPPAAEALARCLDAARLSYTWVEPTEPVIKEGHTPRLYVDQA